jgi:hypothetical protein
MCNNTHECHQSTKLIQASMYRVFMRLHYTLTIDWLLMQFNVFIRSTDTRQFKSLLSVTLLVFLKWTVPILRLLGASGPTLTSSVTRFVLNKDTLIRYVTCYPLEDEGKSQIFLWTRKIYLLHMNIMNILYLHVELKKIYKLSVL